MNTRDRLIEVATKWFHDRGFQAVGLEPILREVGISKQAFYKHFDSKSDLAVAVLRSHAEWWDRESRRMMREHAGDCPRAQLEKFAEIVLDMTDSSDFRGCIYVNAVAEFPDEREPIHIAAVESKLAAERVIEDVARATGAADPEALAHELGTYLQGVVSMRHVLRDRQVAAQGRRMVKRILDWHLGPVEAPLQAV